MMDTDGRRVGRGSDGGIEAEMRWSGWVRGADAAPAGKAATADEAQRAGLSRCHTTEEQEEEGDGRRSQASDEWERREGWRAGRSCSDEVS